MPYIAIISVTLTSISILVAILALLKLRTYHKQNDSNPRIRLLDGIVQQRPIILFTTDSSGIIRHVEGKILHDLDLKPEKFLGEAVHKLYPQEPIVNDDFERALGGDSLISTVEMFGLTLDVYYQPLKNTQQQITGVMGFAVDVTEYKRLTDLLQIQTGLLQNVTNPIISTDIDFIITASNLAADYLYGDGQISLIGRSLLTTMHVSAPDYWKDDMQSALAKSESWQAELTISSRYDTQHFMLTSVNRLEDDLGNPTGFAFVQHDITERKSLTERALQLRLEQERGKLFRDFVRDISHDLRTPLAIAKTSLELVELKTPNVDKRHTQRIHKQIAHIVTLVEDLVHLSRLDYETNTETRSHIQLNTFIRDITDALTSITDQNNQHLRFKATEQALYVNAENNNLHRAITNIITNATQYTPSGGKINVTLSRKDGFAQVSVQDTGIGISSTDLPHVFDRLYRGERGRTFSQGSGLGLAITRKIIEQHGGSIAVSSQPEQGSTFTIKLPVIDQPQIVLNPLEKTS